MFREQVSGDVEVIFLFVCLCTVYYGFDCTYDVFHGGNTSEETLMLPLKYCLFTNTEKFFFHKCVSSLPPVMWSVTCALAVSALQVIWKQ